MTAAEHEGAVLVLNGGVLTELGEHLRPVVPAQTGDPGPEIGSHPEPVGAQFGLDGHQPPRFQMTRFTSFSSAS